MTITESAQLFFEACENGAGWEACKAFCKPTATFAAQAEPLSAIRTLEQYTEWMKALLASLTDGRYELRAFSTDTERSSVTAYAVFTGTHLADGPCPPTQKTTNSDYVYVMNFDGSKIVHMTKIWNSGYALNELGWT